MSKYYYAPIRHAQSIIVPAILYIYVRIIENILSKNGNDNGNDFGSMN